MSFLLICCLILALFYLMFQNIFHPLVVYLIITSFTMALYQWNYFGLNINPDGLSNKSESLLIFSMFSVVIGAVTAFFKNKINSDYQNKIYKPKFTDRLFNKYSLFIGIIILSWAIFFLYESYTYVIANYGLFTQGLRSAVVHTTDVFSKRWYIHDPMIAGTFISIAYMFYLPRNYKTKLLIIILSTSILVYSIAYLARARLIDAILIYLLILVYANNFKVRKVITAKLILVMLAAFCVYLLTTYIRADTSLYGDKFRLYFVGQLYDYLTNGFRYLNSYLDRSAEAGTGFLTFRFIYLPLNFIGFDLPTPTPRYQIFGALTHHSVFETPNMVCWIYDDLGLVGSFVIYSLIGYFSVHYYSQFLRHHSPTNLLRLLLMFLILSRAKQTSAFYDIWWWLMLFFTYFVDILHKFNPKIYSIDGGFGMKV